MAETRLQRRLAAILSADVVGYSHLMGMDEAGTLSRLTVLRRELVDPVIAAHSGRVVKLIGDGTLVEFASVVDAVTCAVAIQTQMPQRDVASSQGDGLRLRIGIHIGDIIINGGDIYGDGVNIAARIEGLSVPGGVSISEDAWRQVRGKVAAEFVDTGEHNLKNIASPVRVFRIELGEKDALEPATAGLLVPEEPSIAVLPFHNMSDNSDQEYFADGIVEDIITALSRFKELFVIARNSSFQYRRRAIDIRQIARELGVRYVIEGSVRKAANRLRITGQLIEAATRTQLWADRFEGSLEDVFELQDRFAEVVIGAVMPKLRQSEIERARRKPPDNLQAYDLYLRSLPHAWANSPEEVDKAIELIDAALRIDPNYAAAHGIAAWCHFQRVGRGSRDPGDREAAVRHARAVVAAGSDDATALAFAAFVIAIVERDYDIALGAAAQALALNSNSAVALARSAYVNAFAGHYDTAIEHGSRSLRLSPLDPMRYSAECALSIAYFKSGRFDQAAQAARRTVQANSRYHIGYFMLAASEVHRGRLVEARQIVQKLKEVDPTFGLGSFQGLALGTPAEMQVLFSALRQAGSAEF
jgi:adenylate cyclase